MSDPRHKQFDSVQVKADGPAGEVVALASVFGNVDLVGDRMLPGAFEKTLGERRDASRRLPIVASHDWDDPMKTIGGAEPTEVTETDEGLQVKARLHIDSNPIAAQVFKLMQEGLWTDWSFGYTVPDGGEEMKDGVNEISEVKLVEAGPTLKGANPEAQLQAVKALAVAVKWDGSPSRFSDEQYARSCVLDRGKCGQGDLPAKQRYSLPIREPGGALNADAVHAAAGRINQVEACAEAKTAAKNALRRAYGQLGEEAPESLKSYPDEIEDGKSGDPPRPQDPTKNEIARAHIDALRH